MDTSIPEIDHAAAARDLEELMNSFPRKEGYLLTALQQLTRDTDEDTTLRIMARFCENLRETVKEIKIEEADSQADAIKKLVHRVAGTAELLGFAALGQTARELEAQLKNLPVDARAKQLLHKFLDLSHEVLNETRAHCPNLNHYLL